MRARLSSRLSRPRSRTASPARSCAARATSRSTCRTFTPCELPRRDFRRRDQLDRRRGPRTRISVPHHDQRARRDTFAGCGDGMANFLTNLGSPSRNLRGFGLFANGTSFSAPMVSGTVALMLAVAPNLSATRFVRVLTSSAKPFPAGSTCTTANCGAGIVDAHAAVLAAQVLAGAARQLRRAVVEFARRLRIRLGNQFRPPGRSDLCLMVHLRSDRQGMVAGDERAA